MSTPNFEAHVAAYFAEYLPEGLRENELVQSLAETRWRLNRIFSLESALLARTPEPVEGAPAPTELDCYLFNEKSLRHLHLQESRLNRRFDKDLIELRDLQEKRRTDQPGQSHAANGFEFSGQDEAAFLSEPKTSHDGFEFSLREVKRRASELAPKLFADERAA